MSSKRRNEGWKVGEDESLCRARLMIAGDPETGINQKETTMWVKIQEQFELNRPTEGIYRDAKSCSTRWKKINRECMAYGAAFRRAELARTSGGNNTDVVLLADSYFHSETGSPFKLSHCWALLKHEPKYQNPPESGGSVNLEDDGTPTPESEPSSSTRPIGTKSKKTSKNSDCAKKMEEYMVYAKARDAKAEIDRAKELALAEEAERHAEAARQYAEDMRTMLVNPNNFTPNKKKFWERQQKVIMDREMADVCTTPPPPTNSSTARNLWPPPNGDEWLNYDLNRP